MTRENLIITESNREHPPAAVDPSHSIESAFPARFLKPWHLTNAGVDTYTDTIRHVQWEQVTTDGKAYERKLALYFEKARTPYLLTAKADAGTLREKYRVRTFGDLIGLRVTIEIVQDRRHGEILRIKPTPPPAPAPQAVAPAVQPDAADAAGATGATDEHDNEHDDRHQPQEDAAAHDA